MIGSVSLEAEVPGDISGGGLTAALQAMVDGAEQNFLLRRTNTGPSTVNISGEVTIEFALDPDG